MSKGAGRWAALVVTSFLVHGALTVNSTETALWNTQGQHGSLLVQQLADTAAPLAMGRDMVSLSVLTTRYEHHPGIASIRIFNSHNERLAEAGLTRDEGRLFSAPLQLQQQLLGQVDLRLVTPGKGDIIRASLGNLGISAVLHLLLLAGVVFMSHQKTAPARGTPVRTQPSVPTSVPAATLETPVELSATPASGSHLHIALDDPNGLLHRVNATLADEMLTVFDQLIDRTARLYGGEVATPFGTDGVTVHFLDGEAAERPLRALAAAQLFLQLVTDVTNERRACGRLTLPCKAGIVHEQASAVAAATLARTAPAERILTSLPNAAYALPCRLGGAVRLAVSETHAHQVAKVESFDTEYQQQINNQSKRILAPAETA